MPRGGGGLAEDVLLRLPWRERRVQAAALRDLLHKYPHAAQCRDGRGNTALHLAAEHRADWQVVSALLAANLEAASTANADGWRYAAAPQCRRACAECSGRTRRAGAHPLVTRARACACRPLHLAATKHAGLDVVAELLKAAPAAAGMVDHNADYTPLHCAAQSGADLEVILALLQAHPEAACERNKGGGTALHLAAWGKSKLAVLQALIKANPQAAGCADSAGWLPLHCAAAHESAEEEVRLGDCARGSRCGKCPPLLSASDAALAQVIEELLSAFPGAATRNSHGELPLHLAAKARAGAGVIKQLLRAHPEAAKTAGQAGLLPLHLAAGRKAGLAVVATLLKSYAAATGIASDDGDLPLHLAASDAELLVGAASVVLQHSSGHQ